MRVGAPSNFVMTIDFNALPSSVSWTLEEEALGDGAIAQPQPDAAQQAVRVSTHDSDVLKRMDIYGCT